LARESGHVILGLETAALRGVVMADGWKSQLDEDFHDPMSLHSFCTYIRHHEERFRNMACYEQPQHEVDLHAAGHVQIRRL
jgi:hypothetical protein